MRGVVARALWDAGALLKHRLNDFEVREEDRLIEGGRVQKLAQARQLLQPLPRAGGLVEVVVFTAARLRLLVTCLSTRLLEFLLSRI